MIAVLNCPAPFIKEVEDGAILFLVYMLVCTNPKAAIQFSKHTLIVVLAPVALRHACRQRFDLARDLGRLSFRNICRRLQMLFQIGEAPIK